MTPNDPRAPLWLWLLAATLAVICAIPAVGQTTRRDRPRRPRSDDPDKAAAARREADKEMEDEFRSKLSAPATNPDDETQRLLAQRERKQGPSFPGKDPAFLVLPRPTERANTANQIMNPQVRDMIEKGLAYLARTQEADGGWSDAQFPSNTGSTALACLALMGEGSRPRIGKYGRNIDRGLEFILKNVQSGGVLAGKGSNPYGPAYEHAFSTLALLYAYGDMPRYPDTRDVIARAIQAIARSQRLDGGWRYEFTREGHSDMSVTANVLWVMRTAKKSGFTVSAESIKKGVEFVEKCAMPDGTFRYRAFGIYAEPSLGGTGVIALANNGNIEHMLIGPARDRIAYDYRRYSVEDLRARRYFVFGCFYASLAIYMCGDQYFIPWYEKSAQVLAAVQRKDGEFPDEHDNTIYSTAMSLMALQSPLGYLPIYER